jgi:hypothetical protein
MINAVGPQVPRQYLLDEKLLATDVTLKLPSNSLSTSLELRTHTVPQNFATLTTDITSIHG